MICPNPQPEQSLWKLKNVRKTKTGSPGRMGPLQEEF
jgi:hypothetical protein